MAGDAVTLGETEWNMRGVSRAKGSLLRFMKEEIPGVTSPMVYVAMMFSWFAWHVEDHDLHSLNYLHMGAGKTWYGVPRDAAVAFEEVVRVQGYGGEINPLVTFAILGEKTTVISPEVFICAGIPCCRLVQNAGEFVVTFPRAYHSGFSHGFNFGEAANIATPEWLKFAKDAAIRRASINYPPMVSHFQLLYDLALELCSSTPMNPGVEPRSSRLKDKKKGEGETLVKELFLQNVIQNNELLHILGKGSSVVLLPQNSSDISVQSKSHMKLNSRLSLGLCSPEEGIKSSKLSVYDDTTVNRNQGVKNSKCLYSVKGKFSSLCAGNRLPTFGKDSETCMVDSHTQNSVTGKENSDQNDRLPEHVLFSCVTCGILSYACYAIVHPREAAARYLMSADCSFFNDWIASSGVTSEGFGMHGGDANISPINSCSGFKVKHVADGLYDVPIQSDNYQTKAAADQNLELASYTETQGNTSALGLLALTYGTSSDSEEGQAEQHIPSAAVDETSSGNSSSDSRSQCDNPESPSTRQDSHSATNGRLSLLSAKFDSRGEVPVEVIDPYWGRGCSNSRAKDSRHKMVDHSDDFEADNLTTVELNNVEETNIDPVTTSNMPSSVSPVSYNDEIVKRSDTIISVENTKVSLPLRSDADSSRMHVFCLEHAVEVEQQLHTIGGVHMLLVCNPAYPKVEAEAKLLAEEMGIDHLWNDIVFRDATKEDSERIQAALDAEEAITGNGDWAVKLGINLFYSAILSRSPLYSKQMPYNSVIYNAFGRSSPTSSPIKSHEGKGSGKQKKIVLAGKWCGKVWMSNQVHPFLLPSDLNEQALDRSFHAHVKPERRSDSTCKAETGAATRKSGRKRKKTLDNQSIKKARNAKIEDSAVASEDSPDVDPVQKNKRILRSWQIKQGTPRAELNTMKFGSSVDEDLEGGPSSRLRKRTPKPESSKESEAKVAAQKQQVGAKKMKKAAAPSPAAPKNKAPVVSKSARVKSELEEYQCDMEGCSMSFGLKHDLVLHKRNICPMKGCRKKFFSHKYLLQHRRVHEDDRPLKCPWKGCKMTFKWAWARTEHIRVHTGARPYICTEADCGQTFRFVSDFSRHKRKTGHSAKKKKGRG